MPYIPEKRQETENTPEKQPQQAAAYTRLWPALLCVFTVMVIYGAVRLFAYGMDFSSSRSTGQKLQQIYKETEPAAEEHTPVPENKVLTATPAAAAETPKITEKPETPETPEITETPPSEEQDGPMLQEVPYPNNAGLKVPDRFTRLRKKSKYIIGWLSMEGLEEPVVKKDNSFFLNHDAEGKKNVNGAIFLDEEISLTTRPYTICLYGHNMKSGNMFGRLKKYLKREYLFRHRIVTFDSMYEDGQYAVFAAAEISIVPGTALYYDLWSLNTKDRNEREQAIRRLTRLSSCDSLLDVRADEQILVLVTCIDQDTNRLVVAARRLREGETENRLDFRKE